MQLRGVLVEAAIAQLLMAEQVVDDGEGVLDASAHLRQRSLDRLRQRAQRLWQRLDDAALDRDVPRHIAVGQFGPLVRPSCIILDLI